MRKDTKLQIAVIFTFLVNAKFTSIYGIAVDLGLVVNVTQLRDSVNRWSL